MATLHSPAVEVRPLARHVASVVSNVKPVSKAVETAVLFTFAEQCVDRFRPAAVEVDDDHLLPTLATIRKAWLKVGLLTARGYTIRQVAGILRMPLKVVQSHVEEIRHVIDKPWPVIRHNVSQRNLDDRQVCGYLSSEMKRGEGWATEGARSLCRAKRAKTA